MRKTKNSLVVRKDDYDVLVSCIRGGYYGSSSDRSSIEELQAELKKATLVEKNEFPPDVVRLNSKVRIMEEQNEKVMEVMVVTPDKANIRERKISVLAPIGTALIGFRKGQKVAWQVPAGRKTFTIVDVIPEEA